MKNLMLVVGLLVVAACGKKGVTDDGRCNEEFVNKFNDAHMRTTATPELKRKFKEEFKGISCKLSIGGNVVTVKVDELPLN